MSAIEVGQWRVWEEKDPRYNFVFRITDVPLFDGFRIFYPHDPDDFTKPSGAMYKDFSVFWSSRLLTTPREVIDAYLASLPEEQRARVMTYPNVGSDGDGIDVIIKDGPVNNSLRVVRAMAAVDSCLVWLRSVLAKTAPVGGAGERPAIACACGGAGRCAACLYATIGDEQRATASLRTRLATVTAERDALRTKHRCICDDPSDDPCQIHYRENQLQALCLKLTAERDEARRVANAANCIGPWRWQGNAEDDIASMSEGMEITMLAGDLRAMIAERDEARAKLDAARKAVRDGD